MPRRSRFLLNFLLLLISASGQFSLHDFFQTIGVGITPQQIAFIIYHILKHLGITILLNAVSNIRELYAPFAALITAILWIVFGHSCEACNELYNVYRSAPSDSVLGRLWFFYSKPEHRVLFIVLCFFVTRLSAQWSTFLYLFKLHKLPDKIQSTKSKSTVIIAAANIEQQRVEECLTSCLLSKVPGVLIVTSKDQFIATENAVDTFRKRFPDTMIGVIGSKKTRKCDMILDGITWTDREYFILVDPSVFWPYRFLDRLLSSFNPKIGFAMMCQRVRRFKLPFIEISPGIETNPAFPEIGIFDGEHAARAIACRRALFQTDGFRTTFSRTQPREVTSYDEERGAACLERWTMQEGYGTVKVYAGHDAFEPPVRMTPNSDVWTHRAFNFFRYIRQALRVRLRYLLIPATQWASLPFRARASHGLGLFIVALAVDFLLSFIVFTSPVPKKKKLDIIADAIIGPEIKSQAQRDVMEIFGRPEALMYTLFVWLHGRVRIWAGACLTFNLLAETEGEEVLIDRGIQTDFDKDDDHPDDISSRGDPQETQSIASIHSNSSNRPIGSSHSIRSNHSTSQRSHRSTPPSESRSSRASTPSSKDSDPVQRLRNSPLYRPGSPPSTRSFATQTSPRQASRPRSLSPITQWRQESTNSRPNTPNEGSPLREEMSYPFQERWSLSGSPSRDEQWSRTPVLSPKAQRASTGLDAASEPQRHGSGIRSRASDAEDFISDSSHSKSPSPHGSREGSPLRQPSFTPSQPRLSSRSPPLRLSTPPRLATPPRTLMPPPSPEPQAPPVKRDPPREHTPTRTANTTIGETPDLYRAQTTSIEPVIMDASPSARSKAKAKARQKPKRAAPSAAADSQRKRRCPKCRRLHAGECIEK